MLRDLQLRNFRCFESIAVEFSPGFNFIVGANGQGKTTLLEAACVLAALAIAAHTRVSRPRCASGSGRSSSPATRTNISCSSITARFGARWPSTASSNAIRRNICASSGWFRSPITTSNLIRGPAETAAALSRLCRKPGGGALSTGLACLRARAPLAQCASEIAAAATA